MARRYDPERRQRIIDAAIAVVGERGIAGLSHRAVAAEADVPLGSTTYHFATLDELLVAALRQANGVCLADVRALGATASTRRRRSPRRSPGWSRRRSRVTAARMELEYELYLAALRHAGGAADRRRMPGRDGAAARTADGDLRTARALVALIDGLVLQHLLTGQPFDPEAVRAGLAGVLD